jgi:hypothetical protein
MNPLDDELIERAGGNAALLAVILSPIKTLEISSASC